jgi:hypothetical protein
MEKKHIPPHLTKLLKSLVFNEFDIDFEVKGKDLAIAEYNETLTTLSK